jgi:hypothetical protein
MTRKRRRIMSNDYWPPPVTVTRDSKATVTISSSPATSYPAAIADLKTDHGRLHLQGIKLCGRGRRHGPARAVEVSVILWDEVTILC